eukprot:GHVR01148984.1.p1 GENE.GHVR01148984.1~~GHVR01148984.1.p1  ORF type:complete len:798 (+),score=190.09 GHVR01148984.1:58-2451(+)
MLIEREDRRNTNNKNHQLVVLLVLLLSIGLGAAGFYIYKTQYENVNVNKPITKDASQPVPEGKPLGATGTPNGTPDGKPGVTPDGKPGVIPDGKPGVTPDGKPGVTPDGKPGVTPDGEKLGGSPDNDTPEVRVGVKEKGNSGGDTGSGVGGDDPIDKKYCPELKEQYKYITDLKESSSLYESTVAEKFFTDDKSYQDDKFQDEKFLEFAKNTYKSCMSKTYTQDELKDSLIKLKEEVESTWPKEDEDDYGDDHTNQKDEDDKKIKKDKDNKFTKYGKKALNFIKGKKATQENNREKSPKQSPKAELKKKVQWLKMSIYDIGACEIVCVRWYNDEKSNVSTLYIEPGHFWSISTISTKKDVLKTSIPNIITIVKFIISLDIFDLQGIVINTISKEIGDFLKTFHDRLNKKEEAIYGEVKKETNEHDEHDEITKILFKPAHLPENTTFFEGSGVKLLGVALSALSFPSFQILFASFYFIQNWFHNITMESITVESPTQFDASFLESLNIPPKDIYCVSHMTEVYEKFYLNSYNKLGQDAELKKKKKFVEGLAKQIGVNLLTSPPLNTTILDLYANYSKDCSALLVPYPDIRFRLKKLLHEDLYKAKPTVFSDYMIDAGRMSMAGTRFSELDYYPRTTSNGVFVPLLGLEYFLTNSLDKENDENKLKINWLVSPYLFPFLSFGTPHLKEKLQKCIETEFESAGFQVTSSIKLIELTNGLFYSQTMMTNYLYKSGIIKTHFSYFIEVYYAQYRSKNTNLIDLEFSEGIQVSLLEHQKAYHELFDCRKKENQCKIDSYIDIK